MSMQERFQQSALRRRGRILASLVSEEFARRTPSEGVTYSDGSTVAEAYGALGLDKYDKLALLAYLVEDGCERYGNMGPVDEFACELLCGII